MASKKTPALPYEISERVRLQALTQAALRTPGQPSTRPLRIYTLDPSVSHRLGGVTTVNVPFETLQPGPIGSLFEIDGTGAPTEVPVSALDLDHPAMLLSSGLAPTPADGRFHLQMVYAVCSLTYNAFRRALGRDLAWACGVEGDGGGMRLRVRPFGMHEENAYYDRDEKGLAFGYFRAKQRPAGHTVPNGLIFTSLSHDVVAHETTHALLDALRSDFYTPTNTDVPGFHEGFADIVALLQHFTYPDVVEQTMRDARGSLSRAMLLTSIAQEFGNATSTTSRPSPLRSAVDVEDPMSFDADAFVPGRGGPTQYKPDLEAHDMGSVLLAAVFEAFVTIFRRKSERYFRIAGIAPDHAGQAELGGELVKVLAQEASDIASHFLDICIRAIDYCPPVDMELGEYLRALITADRDVVGEDRWGYREALMRAFRRRRLFPDHVNFMSEDAVMWQAPAVPLMVRELAFSKLRFEGDPGRPASERELERQAHALGAFVTTKANAEALRLIAPGAPLPKNVTYAAPPRVQSVRATRRVAPDGRVLFDVVAEVTQSCTVKRGGDLFDVLGGCTMMIDPTGNVRYAIYKKLDSTDRQERQHAAIRGPLAKLWKKEGKKFVPERGVFRILHKCR
jgi:hypothetical protein